MKVYTSNPSVPSADEIRRRKRTRFGDDVKGLVVDGGSGEILGHGGAMVYEWEEVDKERFVKLYLAGLKQAAGLSKAGLAVFEIVYKQLQNKPGQDTITLSILSSVVRAAKQEFLLLPTAVARGPSTNSISIPEPL